MFGNKIIIRIEKKNALNQTIFNIFVVFILRSKLKIIHKVSTHSNKTSKYILTVNIFPLQEMSIIKLLQNNNVLSLMHPSFCKAKNSKCAKIRPIITDMMRMTWTH